MPAAFVLYRRTSSQASGIIIVYPINSYRYSSTLIIVSGPHPPSPSMWDLYMMGLAILCVLPPVLVAICLPLFVLLMATAAGCPHPPNPMEVCACVHHLQCWLPFALCMLPPPLFVLLLC